MKILLTGGAGYIGSHTALQLLECGYEVVVADNLCNSSYESIRRVQEHTGKPIAFYEIDVADGEAMDALFKAEPIDAVFHFAGLKAVGESVQKPLEYYRNNLSTTITLLDRMYANGVRYIVYSSSATVYDAANVSPRLEDMSLGCTNPYGWTKFMGERIIQDFVTANPEMSAVLLRYFNPIGAHESGCIGEDPAGITNNLMPYISQVAIGKLEKLHVFGNDYDTRDGTGVRDYLHVVDLAIGHIKALEYALKHTGTEVFNLGTGCGYSVLEIVDAFENTNGVKIPYVIDGRRAGDIDEYYADPSRANEVLGWKAERTLSDMCRDTWTWLQKNPNGFRK